jgi:hypothetical protein
MKLYAPAAVLALFCPFSFRLGGIPSISKSAECPTCTIGTEEVDGALVDNIEHLEKLVHDLSTDVVHNKQGVRNLETANGVKVNVHTHIIINTCLINRR